jgi:hypothetical protein
MRMKAMAAVLMRRAKSIAAEFVTRRIKHTASGSLRRAMRERTTLFSGGRAA